MIRLSFAALLVLPQLLSAHAGAVSPPGVADFIVFNGRIYTLNQRQPWAEAVAIRGDRIVAVGETKTILRERGRGTKLIDAGGRLVLPGFVDSHIHFMDGSFSLTRVNLDDTRNVSEIQKSVAKFARAYPDAPWVLGRGWSYPEFGPAALPDKKYLDEAVPDRPVFLECFDGHTYWANSRALALAGIKRDTPDPPNGTIVRDQASGEPTGTLKESAADLVFRVLPQPSRLERLRALQMGMAAANRAGLTRAHSCGGDFEYLDLYDELRRQGKLTLRMNIAYFLNPPELTGSEIQSALFARNKFHDDWVSVAAVKMMLDGVIESHTAAMVDPYADDATQRGKLFWDPARYTNAVAKLDDLGFQIFTHAIGERAVHLALDAYQNAATVNHTTGARHRIEHIETITPEDIPRFGSLGVIPSFQPLHAYPDEDTLNVWLKNAGHEREPRAWAWRSIANAGGRLAFGSDWPVVTLDPWQGIQNAVTRQTRDGKPEGGWVPEQRISLAEAIDGYTLGAAFGGRRDKLEGSLEPGKLADLIIISQNLFEIDPHAIWRTEVLLTMIGGEPVYQSAAFEGTRAQKREVGQ